MCIFLYFSEVTSCCQCFSVYFFISPWRQAEVSVVVYSVCKMYVNVLFSLLFSSRYSQNLNSLPCDTLVFLPRLHTIIPKSCCFWTKDMHIWMVTNRFLLWALIVSSDYHTHTPPSPLHKCNTTPNYGQPLVKLVLLGNTKLPSLIS